ncbi:hypothetical protein AVEN_129777-1 [Araneus ventricosus]|uniref:Uncharacterized protein n=1 Tax=Araneus ventricosus TaxID=182803 RepID=A0A4Y2WD47_ARAVE|nr:hypothetical protein AVEN_129777-1 [Araneus ventricosus]
MHALLASNKEKRWCLDSGCTIHLSSDESIFVTLGDTLHYITPLASPCLEPFGSFPVWMDGGRSGIKTLSLLPISVITVAFTTFVPRCVIFNRVPLRSLGISRLRIRSTGTPTIILDLSEGAPDNSKILKSSTEYDAPC